MLLPTYLLVMHGRVKPSDNVFDAMDEFWVEIADKNQTDFQLSFLKNHLDVDGCVLDLACGSGRHLIPLTKAGYDVVGFDVSLNLLRIAKQRLGEAVLVRGDMRFLPFKEGAFKAIISICRQKKTTLAVCGIYLGC